MNRARSKRMKVLGCLLAMLSLFAIHSGRAYAGVGDPDHYLPSAGNDSGYSGWLVVSNANGRGDFYSPTSINYMYVPTTSAIGALGVFPSTSDNNGGFVDTTTVRRASYDPSTNITSCASTVLAQINKPPKAGTAVTFDNTVPTSKRLVVGATTYNVYCITASTLSPWNIFFRLLADIYDGSFLGVYAATGGAAGTGFANVDQYGSPPPWNLTLNYGLDPGSTCDQTGNGVLGFYDMDVDDAHSPQNANMRIRVKRTSKSNPADVTYMDLQGNVHLVDAASHTYKFFSNAELGDSKTYVWSSTQGKWISTGVPYDNVIDVTEDSNPNNASNTFERPLWQVTLVGGYSINYRYSMELTSMGPKNKVRVKLPYDQASMFINCGTPASLTCSFNGDSQEVGSRFSVSSSNLIIRNGGSQDASGSITVSVPGGGSTTGTFAVPGNNQINGGSVTGLAATIAVPAGAGSYTVTGTLSSPGVSVTPCNATAVRTAYPYLRTYGADVWAGGGFGSTCTPAQAHVYAYSSGTGTTALGSSAQFGVAAVLNVNGFYSSSLRTLAGTNIPVNGTTFSNNAGDATYGGAYGAGTCMTDYYATSASSQLADKGMFSGAFSGTGKQRFSSSAGTIGSITVPKGVQAVVYANGDVTINGNITYDTAVRTSTSDIPYFILVAKGNIRVSPGVTRLDGLYIAQPTDNSATNGKFYTCYPSGGPTQANLDSSCNSQLVVNGAVIAKEVKFFRTNNTVRNSTAGEQPSDFGTGAGTNAAEVINFSPEMYMAPSPMSDPSSIYGPNGTGKYNAIYSLPPVF